MAQFKYSQSFSFALPKIKIDKDAAKKQRIEARTRIVKAHQAGMLAVEQALGPALDDAMKSQWSWPSGTRDIVETGQLMNSRKLVTSHAQTKSTISIKYTSPYAAIMYYGGLIQPYGNKNAAAVSIPGRPWVEAIMEGTYGQPKFDLATPYNTAFRTAFG